ncbi:probable receptor-like protein kinase At1g80640 [Cucurbita pepo subsp. pepo]|uniref:probable receptor-like protein kinase At1g80640 n=1 Tax=Cucurbita pepo subsp. pepo TaxID=3664 RepID=UPI000C9D5055|nr:probable receptor-like protein kinase At1g80640 [Cucurbita pepo subsp. pepo]
MIGYAAAAAAAQGKPHCGCVRASASPILNKHRNTTPISLFLLYLHLILIPKANTPIMNLLLLLLLLLLLRFCSVFVGSSAPLPSLVPPFSDSMAAAAASSPEISMGMLNQRSETHNRILIVLIVCASFGAVSVISLILWVYYRRNSTNIHKRNTRSPDAEKGFVGLAPFLRKFSSNKMVGHNKFSVPVIDYAVLEKSTNIFQESNILGVGGFGRVYKAQLEQNLHVAVKKLECLDKDSEKEFLNEVEILSKTHHSNIIQLLGYTIHEESRLLVYELMENGSLETLLHGPSHGEGLTWHMRMKIALDSARGLEYLHEHCKPAIIHRDLKSSNILLDANFNAKLSDFGLSVIVGAQNKNEIKLSGTMGYVAPEYLLDGKLTDKSDVYAFGVVLLELLLGKRPVEKLAPTQCQSIVTWAMPHLTDRSKLPDIVDPVIKNTMDPKHLFQVAAVAVLCVQPEPSYRPLITDVLHSLIPLVPVELGGTLRSSTQQQQQASVAED